MTPTPNDALDWDVELIRSVKIAPRHLGVIMDVHRITAANWLTNQTKPTRELWPKANAMMRVVRQLKQEGVLPLADRTRMQAFEADVQIVLAVRDRMEEDE